MNTWVKRALIAIPALIILIYGAIFVYAKIINDPDPKLDSDDLSAAVFGDSSSTNPIGGSTDPTTPPPITIADTEPTQVTSSDAMVSSDHPATSSIVAATDGTTVTSDDTADFDGVWAIADGSEFGYRVKEVLGGVDTTATGRGTDITGSITIEDTTVTDGSFDVEVATITSDRSSRDNQFKGRIMSTDEFPTASFVLTEPIEFGTIPTGEDQTVATATGDLTLHGVTNSVTFDVTAQASPDRIGVLGEIPVVFADYDIPDASAGPARVGDDGLLEFILVFEPSDDTAANSTESMVSTDTVTSSSSAAGSSTATVAGFRARATASTVSDSTPGGGTGVCTASDADSAAPDDTSGTAPAEGGGVFDGTWAVTDQSTFGYRVQEVLGGVDTTATGRSSEITGSMTIVGTTVTDACFEVDVASITSDRSSRDNQFKGRIMSTDEFPTASFVLTEPIELGQVPTGDEQLAVEAVGELTLHGVTNTVTFELTAQASSERIGVLGEIPIVFADYDIPDASAGPARVGDDGLLEFLLVFEPAAGDAAVTDTTAP